MSAADKIKLNAALTGITANQVTGALGFNPATRNAATTSAAGLMSAADKEKLDNIASEANKYVLPTAATGTLGGIKVGANLNIDSNGVLSAAPGVSVETTGSGNAITSLSETGGVITAEKESTFSLSDHTHSNYVSSAASSGSGNAVSSVSVSGNVLTYVKGITALTAHPTIPVSSDTTGATSPGSAGTFNTVDSITRDTNGHVTKINTTKVTMPTIPTSLPASNTVDTYTSTSTAPISGKGVAAALATLDVNSVGGTDKYISTISETDGKISATAVTFSTAVKAIKVDVATAACSASSVEWSAVQNKVNAGTSAAGLVSTGTQSFAGKKTFTNDIAVGNANLVYSTSGTDKILTISFS